MLTLVIQAGGQSNRMGRDKALLPFCGEPLIQRVINRLTHLPAEILVTTNQPEKFAFLNLPLYPDILPGRGALGGLYTALRAAHHPFVAVVACDMPFANPDILSTCRTRLEESEADAVLPRTEQGLEPFHAVYRRKTCLPAVEHALATGQRRVISWHQDRKIHVLLPQEIAQLDPLGLAFWNINTPEAFQQAEKKACELLALTKLDQSKPHHRKKV